MSLAPRAVVVQAFGVPDSHKLSVLDPGMPGSGKVRVRVFSAGVSYADVLVATGRYQVKPPLPFVPGSEFAGVIDAVGPGVDGGRVGERVMASGFGGAFCEAAIVPARSAIPIPDKMSFDEAAIFKVSYSTAYYALVQRGQLKAGESLLVLGAGGAIGYAATEIGKALGAFVLGSASEARRTLASQAGADVTVDSRSETWREDVKAANGGRPIDVVIDPVGGSATEAAFRSLAWNGRHLVIGFAGGSIAKLPVNLPLLKGASLVGVDVRQFGEIEPEAAAANVEALLAMHRAGKLRPPVATRFPLAEFAAAMAEVHSGSSVGRIVLSMREE